MKLNNKGITLTEIIISIALISIVLIFLFSLLITVNDINEESKVNSTYLINKSLIIKNIESDLSKIDKTSGISIEKCNASDIYSSYLTDDLEQEYKASECIKINNSYIGIYYYDKQSSYVISYINKDNDIKVTKLLEKFDENNVDKINGVIKDNFKMKLNIGDSNCGSDLIGCSNQNNSVFSTITIPIIGPDGKDYSIIISYYGKVSIV